MVAESKSKKRKGDVPDEEIDKAKKVKKMGSDGSQKKRKAIGDAELTVPKKSKAPKDSSSITTKKVKTPKDAAILEQETTFTAGAPDIKSKKPKKKNIEEMYPVEELLVDHSEAEEVFSDEEIDDQTEALLKGFDSDNDDEKYPEDQGYEEGQEIPKIEKKLKKKAKAAETGSTSDKPGVIYVGRIPHGFYEHQMKQYFSQFGDILRIRLSRNRKTGRSKHFAFLEFKSADVADIIAKTMDNYLLFGHILKCKVVPVEQVHKDLFKGANKRFKKVPWNKLEGRKLSQGMIGEKWDKRVEKEEQRRARKGKILEQMGYSFEAPKLKSAKDLLRKADEPLAIEANSEVVSGEVDGVESSMEQNQVSITASEESSKERKKAKKTTDEANTGDNGVGTLPNINGRATKVAKHQKPKKFADVENRTKDENLGDAAKLAKVTKPAKAFSGQKPVKNEKLTEVEKLEKVDKSKKGKKTKGI